MKRQNSRALAWSDNASESTTSLHTGDEAEKLNAWMKGVVRGRDVSLSIILHGAGRSVKPGREESGSYLELYIQSFSASARQDEYLAEATTKGRWFVPGPSHPLLFRIWLSALVPRFFGYPKAVNVSCAIPANTLSLVSAYSCYT